MRQSKSSVKATGRSGKKFLIMADQDPEPSESELESDLESNQSETSVVDIDKNDDDFSETTESHIEDSVSAIDLEERTEDESASSLPKNKVNSNSDSKNDIFSEKIKIVMDKHEIYELGYSEDHLNKFKDTPLDQKKEIFFAIKKYHEELIKIYSHDQVIFMAKESPLNLQAAFENFRYLRYLKNNGFTFLLYNKLSRTKLRKNSKSYLSLWPNKEKPYLSAEEKYNLQWLKDQNFPYYCALKIYKNSGWVKILKKSLANLINKKYTTVQVAILTEGAPSNLGNLFNSLNAQHDRLMQNGLSQEDIVFLLMNMLYPMRNQLIYSIDKNIEKISQWRKMNVGLSFPFINNIERWKEFLKNISSSIDLDQKSSSSNQMSLQVSAGLFGSNLPSLDLAPLQQQVLFSSKSEVKDGRSSKKRSLSRDKNHSSRKKKKPLEKHDQDYSESSSLLLNLNLGYTEDHARQIARIPDSKMKKKIIHKLGEYHESLIALYNRDQIVKMAMASPTNLECVQNNFEYIKFLKESGCTLLVVSDNHRVRVKEIGNSYLWPKEENINIQFSDDQKKAMLFLKEQGFPYYHAEKCSQSERWMKLLKEDGYLESFKKQGYTSVQIAILCRGSWSSLSAFFRQLNKSDPLWVANGLKSSDIFDLFMNVSVDDRATLLEFVVTHVKEIAAFKNKNGHLPLIINIEELKAALENVKLDAVNLNSSSSAPASSSVSQTSPLRLFGNPSSDGMETDCVMIKSL